MWRVIGDAGVRNRERHLLVQCACGARRVLRAALLRRCTKCRLCSDASKRRHGESGTSESAEWRTWCGIKARCAKTTGIAGRRYRGRGIVVCQRWLDSFEAFLDDMGRRPSPLHSIDRIDNDRGYEPGNCRWATMREQSRNRAGLRIVDLDGVSMCLTEWAERVGTPLGLIRCRINRGWTEKEAILTPRCSGWNRRPGAAAAERLEVRLT